MVARTGGALSLVGLEVALCAQQSSQDSLDGVGVVVDELSGGLHTAAGVVGHNIAVPCNDLNLAFFDQLLDGVVLAGADQSVLDLVTHQSGQSVGQSSSEWIPQSCRYG